MDFTGEGYRTPVTTPHWERGGAVNSPPMEQRPPWQGDLFHASPRVERKRLYQGFSNNTPSVCELYTTSYVIASP